MPSTMIKCLNEHLCADLEKYLSTIFCVSSLVHNNVQIWSSSYLINILRSLIWMEKEEGGAEDSTETLSSL